MAERSGAVSVAGDGQCVDVPCKGAKQRLVGEIGQVDGEADALGRASGFNAAGDGGVDKGVVLLAGHHGAVRGRGLVGGCGCCALETAGFAGEIAWGWREGRDDGALDCVDACEGRGGGSGGDDAGFCGCEDDGGRSAFLDLLLGVAEGTKGQEGE